jgi:vacuolar-type H+-ATPase subunit I/STV1
MKPRKKAFLTKGEDEEIQRVKDAKSKSGFSTYIEFFQSLIASQESEVFQEYLDCEFLCEYPLDSKHFVQCTETGKKMIKTREYCRAHGHLKKVIVPWMSLEKIKAELAKVIADVAEGRKDLEKIENLRRLPEENKNLKTENDGLREDIENQRVTFFKNLSTTRHPKSVLEAEEKARVREENLQKKPSETMAENHSKVVQRTVEEKKTTIEEKKVTQVVRSPLENLEWACYFNPNEYVSTEKCWKCQKGRNCPYSQFLVNDQIPPNAKTRPRASEL